MHTRNKEYNFYENVDIKNSEALAMHGLSRNVVKNVVLFSSLHDDTLTNFSCRAISPFSGKLVAPVKHFGIDSDPWMHSILYEDGDDEFIILCQGLNNASLLGSIVLPHKKLFINNYEGWYYDGAYLSRIEMNLPRVLNYFRYCRRKSKLNDTNKIIHLNFAIGNQRVGDFIMQLLMLNELLSHKFYWKKIMVDNIFVNLKSEFMEVETLFPELKSKIIKLSSVSHIEYHVRHYDGILFSDVRVLTNKKQVTNLQKRIGEWLHKNMETLPPYVKKIKACKFTIWVALELEKRVWLEQEEGLINLITDFCNRLCCRNNERLGIVFNGITGYVKQPLNDTLNDIVQQERSIFDRIKKAVPHNVHMHFAGGSVLTEKLLLANFCDFVCAPLGSASVVPSLLLNKPGIVYAYDATDRASFAGPLSYIFGNEHMTIRDDIKPAVSFATANQSYSFYWKKLIEVIEENFRFDDICVKIIVNKS